MNANALVDEARLRRFAQYAARLLPGSATQGTGPKAAHDRAGPGLEFLDVREYTPGDDVRHLDWRQTSRLGRPMVRRYRDESASDWTICVDGSASMGFAGKWQLATELASALAYVLLYGGHRVSLTIFEKRVRAYSASGRGQQKFAEIVRHLAEYEPPKRGGQSVPGACTRVVTSASNVILLSDFLREDAMSDDLRRLRARVHSARAIQVLSQAEAAVEASGPARLYDVESGAEQRITMTAATTAAASEALQAYNQKLRRMFAVLDMPFTACASGDGWDTVLAKHLRI